MHLKHWAVKSFEKIQVKREKRGGDNRTCAWASQLTRKANMMNDIFLNLFDFVCHCFYFTFL